MLWYASNFSFFIIISGSVEKGNLGVPQLPGQGCSFHSFRTNTYKLSFMESPSGIKVTRNVHINLFIIFILLYLFSLFLSSSQTCVEFLIVNFSFCFNLGDSVMQYLPTNYGHLAIAFMNIFIVKFIWSKLDP